MLVKPFWILIALMGTLTTSQAAEPDFYRDIYPFLKTNCISCHNKTTTKADLDMETPEMMKKGGESGPGIIPGKSAESLIVLASLHQEDMEMPPANNKSGAVNLTSSEVALLKLWIDQGAKNSVQQERQVAWQPLAAGVHPIYSVAMTKDGRFAACGRSNQLFVYDLTTRQFVTQIVDATQAMGTAHRALVTSLAFSPDGTRLASGSFREVKVWRREEGKGLTRAADANIGAVLAVLTKDGGQVISADKAGALMMLDASTGKVVKKIPGVNTSGIKLLSISPDATTAAVYGTDATLSVWNLKEGTKISAKTGQSGVYAMAWTADGKTLATAGEDKIVRVWSLPAAGATDWQPAKELKGAAGAIKALIAGPTADRLLTAGEDNKVRVWSVPEGKVLKEINGTGAISLTISTDGKQLATGSSGGVVRLWDVETGKPLSELRDTVASVRQTAALDWTVAAQGLEQNYQKVQVARIEAQNKALDELLKKANEAILTMQKALPEKQKALKPTRDAKAIAQKAVDDATAAIAKAATATAPDAKGKPDAAQEKLIKDAQEKLQAVAMTETSALAALSAVESNIKDAQADVKRITDAKAANTKELAAANAAITTAKAAQTAATTSLAAAKGLAGKADLKPLTLAFSQDGQKIAALNHDGSLNVWAIASGSPIEQGKVGAGSVMSGALIGSANGTFAACGADGAFLSTAAAAKWVLERTLGGEKEHGIFADRVNAVRFSPDGKTLATGGGEPSRSGDIHFFDVATGKLTKTWKDRHQDAVLSLDFSPNGKLLASGASDKIARVTDIATGKQVNLFEGHTHHVMGVAFRADGRVLATAGADGVVMAWDMTLGERKKKIEGWTKEVTSLQYIGPTSQLVTSAGDNRVRVVNDDGVEVRSITKLPDFMQSAASTSNGAMLIGGGEDSMLRVWDGTNGKELAAFGAK